MPATTLTPAALDQAAAPMSPAPAPVGVGARRGNSQPTVTRELSLEERMAAIDAAMTVRLETAALANDINTAHIATTPIDLADVIRGPVDVPRPPVDLYPTPIAALLQRALHRLTVGGWCGQAPRGEQGATCLQDAIYKEARGNHGLASDALDVLMDAIGRQFGGGVADVPAFNDAWGGPGVPLRVLGQAAVLADTIGV